MKRSSKFCALILVFLLALVLPTVVFADDEDLAGQTGPKDKNATVELVTEDEPDTEENDEDADLEDEEEAGPPVRILEKQDDLADLKAERLEMRLTVKGQEMKLDVPPVVKEGRVLIPLRAMAAITGAEVSYDPINKIVTLVMENDDEIQVHIGDNRVIVNGEEMEIDVPAEIEKGRTIVPLRFVAETLGFRVNYDAATKTIDVEDKDEDEEDDDNKIKDNDEDDEDEDEDEEDENELEDDDEEEEEEDDQD